MTEFKANVTEGFRNESFTAEVMDLKVDEISGYTKVIFEFAEGPNLSIFPPREIKDGDVPGYQTLGILINSLSSLNIETFISVDDNTLELDGIRTEPDVCGMTLSMDVKESKWINKEGEEKTNYDWRVTSAESNGTPAPRPVNKESVKEPVKNTPPTDDPKPTDDSGDDLIDTWNTIVLSALEIGPLTEAGLMKAMKISIIDKTEQSKMNKVRRVALDSMVSNELIVKNGSEYSLA